MITIAGGIIIAVVFLAVAPLVVIALVNWRAFACAAFDHKWEEVPEYDTGGVLSYKTRHRCSRCGEPPNLIESGELRRMAPDA